MRGPETRNSSDDPERPRWSLDTPLQFLPGVGPTRAQNLERLGLEVAADLLRHFPRRYEDRRRMRPIRDVRPGETVVLAGHLRSLRERRRGGRRHVLTGELAEAAASIELVWFNQPYLAEWLRPGVFLCVHGAVKERRGRLQMVAPEFEVDTGADDVDGSRSLHMQRIVPIYALTRGIQQRFLRRLVHGVIDAWKDWGAGPYDEFHDDGMSLEVAYREIHFPSSFERQRAARGRFVFDDYFRFASRLFFRRAAFRQEGRLSFQTTAELDQKIRSIFPFRFTAEQDRVVSEIVRDLRGPSPMYRLLQGDVGTGKTAVALYAVLVAVRNRHQGAILAPTEILAEQHFRTVSGYLCRYPVRIGLLTGSTRPAERRRTLEGLSNGSIHVVVGTHALVQEAVSFARLGVAVIDEQHRFGVKERQRMRQKGDRPHLLVMTATPIPRSLCMTCYGDLDLSLLEERPAGRQIPRTRIVPPSRLEAALEFVRGELRKGRQAYFVYPLIEESDSLAVPAAVEGQRRLAETVFPEFSIGLVHGKMAAAEKERELQRFRQGDVQVLVTTVVVEVGIDVPNATVLFIEDASRFGLAQLHQLRGRVGRGEHRGFCLVGLGSAGREARARLQAFVRGKDGFEVAEVDLELRGPGDYLGLRQSGRPDRALGSPLEDLDEFRRVKDLADRFWARQAADSRASWRAAFGLDDTGDEANFLGFD